MIDIILPEPHSSKQDVIMNALTLEGVKKIYVACGTKFGKSVAASTALTKLVLKDKNRLYRWYAPVYAQAGIGLKYMTKMLPPEPHSIVSKGKMKIELPYLDNELEFWHTRDPENLEGVASFGNVFDEAAKIKLDAVISARTTITMTQAPELYVSTPNSKNWFYKECMNAKDRMIEDLKKKRIPEYIFITAKTTNNPHVNKNFIDDAKKLLPDRLYRQYILAEFLDDGSVFIGFKECIQGERIDVEGSVQYYIPDDSYDSTVIIGADWAKKNDYTVFTALKIESNKPPELISFMRFNGLSYIDSLKELAKFKNKFKKVVVLMHDKTGIGNVIDDMLVNIDINYQGVTFTQQSKSDMINKLMVTFETKQIRLCNWGEMIRELDSYEVVVNSLGNASYNAPQGLHDDIVCSLMLANFGASEHIDEFNLNFLEDLPKRKKSIENYYKDLINDND